jgi:hypothetical protein
MSGYSGYWGGGYAPLYDQSQTSAQRMRKQRDMDYKGIIALVQAMRSGAAGGVALSTKTRIMSVQPHNDYSGVRGIMPQQSIRIDEEPGRADAILGIRNDAQQVLQPAKDIGATFGRVLTRG